MAQKRYRRYTSLGMTAMTKDDTTTRTPRKTAQAETVKLRLSLSKKTAHDLVRVTRWEKASRDTSLELTGRK